MPDLMRLTLRIAVGHGDASRLSILVDARADDDGTDRVLVLQGLVQRLQDENAAALSSTKARSPLVKSDGSSGVGK